VSWQQKVLRLAAAAADFAPHVAPHVPLLLLPLPLPLLLLLHLPLLCTAVYLLPPLLL
jgi:hypothetical protein